MGLLEKIIMYVLNGRLDKAASCGLFLRTSQKNVIGTFVNVNNIW